MATVRFPDAEAMAVVRRIACDTDDSARCSWATLKTRLSEGGVQMDPDTEDRVSRASQRMSRGSHYRDSTRMSSRISFVQLVSDLQHNKKPEGEAMRYATRRRSPTSTNSMLARPPAAVLGALQELIAAICLHPEWEREDILECLEGACRGSSGPVTPGHLPTRIQRSNSKSKVVFIDGDEGEELGCDADADDAEADDDDGEAQASD